MPEDRRLAAIMFTDIVGYTALMGSDEDKAFKILRKNRNIQKPLIKKYHGKWLKEMGDGILASFNSSSDAVRCAGEIQNEAKKAGIPLRIGIHEGEVVFEGGDVLGDGVNVASRLEELAQEGCIYISETVYKDIKNKANITAEFIEERKLKNVEDPLKIYEVHPHEQKQDHEKSSGNQKIRNRLPYYLLAILVIALIAVSTWHLVDRENSRSSSEKNESITIEKSIAVLPFTNLSNDPEQEYFSDGMTDEILMHLHKIGGLKVISRTSVMHYKGSDKTVSEIANELSVNFILEGSVRKSNNRVRITVQLINVTNDDHLWAESYDRDIDDIFTIQSEIAKKIANELKLKINPEDMYWFKYPTDNVEAYNLYLQAVSKYLLYSDEESQQAIELLAKAIELDPEFAGAYCLMGILKQSGASWETRMGGVNPHEVAEISKLYFLKAIEVDSNFIDAHQFLAWNYLWYEWDFKKAEDEYKKVRALNPNYYWNDFLLASGRYEEAYHGTSISTEINPIAAFPWGERILSCYYANRHDEAISTIEKTEKMGMHDLFLFTLSAEVYLYLRIYEEALFTLEKLQTNFPQVRSPRILRLQAISLYHIGQEEKCMSILNELKQKSQINAGGSPSFYCAMIYSQMGEKDLAFEYLEKAYDAHEVEMYWLKVEPLFEPLHDDPRWQVMLDKVGFPD